MKRIIAAALAVALTGCAGLNPNPSTQGAGGKKSVGTLSSGSFWGGLVNWNFTSTKEQKRFEDESSQLRAQGIESEAQTEKVTVQEEHGITRETVQVSSFTVRSTSNKAVEAICKLANEAVYGGQIIVVSERSEKPRLQRAFEDFLALSEHMPSIRYVDASGVATSGIRPGIVWMPAKRQPSPTKEKAQAVQPASKHGAPAFSRHLRKEV